MGGKNVDRINRMAYIESYKDQAWLLPPALEDLIPEDHVCYLVEALVDAQDYSDFDRQYAGAGHPAYHPRILVKLLIMGILDRVRSSRRLARAARENVVYMYLAEKLSPDFRTISDFRKNHPELIKDIFRHTVRLAKEEGLLDLSYLATDGSKIKANASGKRVLTKEELAVLLRFVDEELEAWAERDDEEDREYGEIRGFDQLPVQSRKTVRKAVEHYVKRMKERRAEEKDEVKKCLETARQEIETKGLKKVSLTDPGSRFMKNAKGKIELSYNPQVTVDRGGYILANDVGQNASDAWHLQPQVRQTEENLGGLPEEPNWSFDAGYYESGNIEFMTEQGIDGYIPDNNEGKSCQPYDKKNFSYDVENDRWICPVGRRVEYVGVHYDRQKRKEIRVYRGTSCRLCSHRRECTKSKDGIRHLKMFPGETAREVMRSKMKTAWGQEIYKLRRQIVEPVLGDIKENKGVRGFLTRGIGAVRGEFNLICAAANIQKIWIKLQEKENRRLMDQSA
jgi:transposase